MRARFLAVLFLAACNNSTTTFTIDVELVDPSGAPPADDIVSGTLSVRVRHGESVLDCEGAECTSPIDNGNFELVLPLTDLEAPTSIQAEIQSDTELRIGAMPAFKPYGESIEQVGVVQIVVVPTSSCRVLELEGLVSEAVPLLSTPITHAAGVARRNTALIAGGDGSQDVDRFDQLTFDRDTPPMWTPQPIGRARGLALSPDLSLVVGENGAWLFAAAPGELGAPRVEAISLPGATDASALVDLDADGAAVVGPARAIHWLSPAGEQLSTTMLALERSRPAAARIGSGVLVVGSGAPEWIGLQGNGELVSGLDDLPAGNGGWLLPSPDGNAALWIGFDVGGVVSGETRIVRGCPSACSHEPGPTWENPRTDVAALVTSTGMLWLIGGDVGGTPSTLVERVRWDAGNVVIDTGISLAHARAGATAFEHASGIVTVAGGRGTDMLRNDFEMCFPPALDPL